MVDGLYANYANPRNFSQVGDFSTIVYRQQALGFNAIRLPFRSASSLLCLSANYTCSHSVRHAFMQDALMWNNTRHL